MTAPEESELPQLSRTSTWSASGHPAGTVKPVPSDASAGTRVLGTQAASVRADKCLAADGTRHRRRDDQRNSQSAHAAVRKLQSQSTAMRSWRQIVALAGDAQIRLDQYAGGTVRLDDRVAGQHVEEQRVAARDRRYREKALGGAVQIVDQRFLRAGEDSPAGAVKTSSFGRMTAAKSVSFACTSTKAVSTCGVSRRPARVL